MKTLDTLKHYFFVLFAISALTLTSCDNDDEIPAEEHEHEVITHVELIFTPDQGETVTAHAEDHDGEGVEELEVDGPINLLANTNYTLTFEILNELHDDHEDAEHKVAEGDDEEHAEDIAAEIKEEADEHQFFFEFTDNAFSDPIGNGNIDNASDPINYAEEDNDINGNPLGLITTWTTGAGTTAGEFTVRLQHQPDIKTSTTGANDGDSDFDLTFELNIQ